MSKMISGAFRKPRKSFKQLGVPRKTADSGVYPIDLISYSEVYYSRQIYTLGIEDNNCYI